MATAIINSQMDAINESFSNISSDLTTIRPLLKNASIGAYPTDSASGSIASFTDGADGIPVKSLSVDLEPVQDLNGYDNPWPAGGGTNIYDDSAKTSALIDSNGGTTPSNAWYLSDYCAVPVGTTKVTLTWESTQSYFQTRLIAFDSSKAVIADSFIAFAASNTYTHTYDIPSTAAFVRVNYSHVVGGTEYPRNNVRLNVGSTDLGYAPYSNICPISGHTEVNVYRTGKNLFDIDSAFGSATGFTKESDGSWYTGAPISYSPNSVVWKAPSGLTGRITLSVVRKTANSTGSQGGRFKWKYTDGATSGIYIANSTSYASFSNVSTSGKTVDSLLWDYGSAVNGTWLKDMQIEAGTTASPYEPYTGTTYPVSLGQTVYGGTLNVTTGVLTVDRKYVLYDGSSDENWSRFSTGSAGAYAMRIAAPDILQSASDVNVMSNYLPAIAGNATWGNYDYFIATTTNAAIYTGIRSITTVGAWRDYLAQNNLQVVYKLATPTTVQLTATQVSTLLGANNIWADSGEISVLYRADVGLYIDKKLAQALNA